MAAAALSPAELQALILQLQTQVATLTSGATSAGLAPAAVVFADTPHSLYADNLIDYSTKRRSSIYEQGCKTLDDKALANFFNITPNQTVVFVEALTCCTTVMGWNVGSKQITTFTNLSGKNVDIIKKTRNRKNGGNETKQKEDEAWRKIPPKDSDEKLKKMGKYRFHWCEHHMAWCMHLPSECHLGNQRKEEQSPTAGGNSATYAAAAASSQHAGAVQ